ncbi:MAG: DNA-3-methyladenine glycosylase I [Chloroflexi bacterium]|nr:DNA-3-methyladenine glycosylase I [Chloroflexota bacterium]
MSMRVGYEIPPRVKPKDDNGYLEMLTKAIFQAGFSWLVIRQKWPNFQRAFDGFDIDKVASYGEEDIERLLRDASIVRNGRKIEATTYNASVFQEIIHDHGSFYNFLRSFDGLPYREKRKALVSRFKGLGPTGAFVFLHTVDEEVPAWQERNE